MVVQIVCYYIIINLLFNNNQIWYTIILYFYSYCNIFYYSWYNVLYYYSDIYNEGINVSYSFEIK